MISYDYAFHAKVANMRTKNITLGREELLDYMKSCSDISSERYGLNWKLAGLQQEVNSLRPENRFLISLAQENPNVQFVKESQIIPPEGGWIEHTLYLVEVSTGPNNPVHEAYFMVGFLNDAGKGWHSFGGYTRLSSQDGSSYERCHYIKALKVLHTQQQPGVINETT